MGRDLFAEAGISPNDIGRDLFAEAGIDPNAEAQKEKARKANERFTESIQPKDATFGDKALATGAAALTGLAAPMAGAAEYLGIKRPAQLIRNVSETTGQIAPTAAPVAEFLGSVLSPMPTKAGNFVAGLLPKAQTVARMGTQGAVGAAFNPLGTAEDKDYLDFLYSKAGQIGEGGILGSIFGKGSQMLLNPKVTEKMQMLKDMGMKYFTPGQLASQIPYVGNILQNVEGKSTSIPIVGPIIEHGVKTAAADFNRAIGNKVLREMGESVPKSVKSGDELINYVNKRISNAYDEITPKLSISNLFDRTNNTTTIGNLLDKVDDFTSGMPNASGNNLSGMVKDEFQRLILDRLDKVGNLSGEQFRNAEKNLGNVAFSYLRNPQLYEVGVALRKLQGELRKVLADQNPALKDQLDGIHKAFREHLPMERAASKLGAKDRIFSPQQFESAISAETKGKGQFASGRSLMYPESQAALSVLGRTIPDSGTAGRVANLAALATFPAHFQQSLPAAAATAALYNKPVMGALTSLATGQRPELIRRLEPTVSGGIARGTGQSVD